jgi:hypothetical protein
MTSRLILLLSTLIVALSSSAARAEPSGQSRSVRIVDEPPAETPALIQKQEPAQPLTLPRERWRNGDAALRVEILPKEEFVIGAPMEFRVRTEKPGYVVLVDVDAQGKLSQIYPNMITLSDPAGVDEKVNFLRAGQSITLPDPGGTFRFVASPPAGVGMVVAILSDTPVQVIDLPDVPTALAGQTKAADFVRETMRSLQILSAEGARAARAPKWAFATKFYGVR